MHKILNYIKEKINTLSGAVRNSLKPLQNKDIFTSLAIILVAFGSFGLGRLSKIEDSREPVVVEEIQKNDPETNAQNKSQADAGEKKYVASKNGSKYFFAWCPGANRISGENKIWFDTKEEAEAAGFGPAANCPGM